jgi:hypothetical protein
MKKIIMLILCIIPMSSAHSQILTEKMVDICTDAQHQDFCHAFVQAVYENSSCWYSTGSSPDFIELKKVFIGFVYSKGSGGYAFATPSAAMAFYEKYGCESFLQKDLIKSKKITIKP